MIRPLGVLLLGAGCTGSAEKPDTGASQTPRIALEGQITNLLTGAGERDTEVCVEAPETAIRATPMGATASWPRLRPRSSCW